MPDDGRLVETAWEDHRESLAVWLKSLLRDDHAAADCLQWTFAKLVETGGPPLAGNLRGWLFRVAQNCARQMLRRRAVEQRGMVQWASTKQLADREPDDAFEELLKRERLVQVTEAVRQLPESQQQVFRMRFHEGLTFARIAGQLGLPLGTVLTRMRLALQSVRERVGAERPLPRRPASSSDPTASPSGDD